MSHAYTYKAVIDSMLPFAKAVFVGYYVRSAYNSLNRFYDSFSKTLQDSTIIHNETSETVTFLVYNASDPCINAQWRVWHWWAIPAFRVSAQADETVEVHGGRWRNANDELKVWVDSSKRRTTYFNVYKKKIHEWDGKELRLAPDQQPVSDKLKQYGVRRCCGLKTLTFLLNVTLLSLIITLLGVFVLKLHTGLILYV